MLVLAKTPQAQAALSGAFEARTTKKTYLALVDGVPTARRRSSTRRSTGIPATGCGWPS